MADAPRPAHHANATRTLFQNPARWRVPDEPDDNAVSVSEAEVAGTAAAANISTSTDADAQASVPTSPTSAAMPGSWSTSSSSSSSDGKSPRSGAFAWLRNASANVNVPALLAGVPIAWAQDMSAHMNMLTRVVQPDFGAGKRKEKAGAGNVLRATWLGHASYIVEFPSHSDEEPVRVLFDPMFSERAGPSAWAGIRRRLAAPCTLAELPDFHFVAISHSHYDHLDMPCIQEIAQTPKMKDVTFLVPLGVKALIKSAGVPPERIHEFDWWEETVLPATGLCTSGKGPTLKFTSVPAQHTSGRSILDRWTTLWCGWVVRQEGTTSRAPATLYHAGDTGYKNEIGVCPIFKEIGVRCGPIDLALLPIWRGGTLSFVSQLGLRLTHHPFLSALHASPEDAVCMHKDLGARHSLAMHFATFAGTEAEALEPVVELMEARREAGLDDWREDGGIGIIDVGEIAEIPLGSMTR